METQLETQLIIEELNNLKKRIEKIENQRKDPIGGEHFVCTDCGRDWGDGSKIHLLIKNAGLFNKWFCESDSGGCGKNAVKYFSGEINEK